MSTTSGESQPTVIWLPSKVLPMTVGLLRETASRYDRPAPQAEMMSLHAKILRSNGQRTKAEVVAEWEQQ